MATTLKLTIADLECLPEDGNRYELIDGELYVSKAPGWKHQRAVMRLGYLLEAYTEETGRGTIAPGPGIIFDDYNGVIPDLVYVSPEREHLITDRGLTGAPDLVVEVLSPGAKNTERDRLIKRQLYSRRGVLEYWIVDPDGETVEVYRLEESDLVLARRLQKSDTLTSLVLPGFSCPAAEIFTK